MYTYDWCCGPGPILGWKLHQVKKWPYSPFTKFDAINDTYSPNMQIRINKYIKQECAVWNNSTWTSWIDCTSWNIRIYFTLAWVELRMSKSRLFKSVKPLCIWIKQKQTVHCTTVLLQIKSTTTKIKDAST